MPADIYARYHRLKGNDVLMVSGTDEHGTPVMVSADREGVSPRELAERYNLAIREDLRDLGISYDCFTRTTTPNHARVTRDIFRTLYEHGCLIEQTTLGAFSAATGNTLPDRYIEGTCPICGYKQARGDQCDNCGNQLDPADLIEPRSVIDGTTPEFRETTHLFLNLPAFAGRLRPWLESKTSWRPVVRRGDRVPLCVDRVRGEPGRRRIVARVVAEPRLDARVFLGEGQHRLPHDHLAEHADRLRQGR